MITIRARLCRRCQQSTFDATCSSAHGRRAPAARIVASNILESRGSPTAAIENPTMPKSGRWPSKSGKTRLTGSDLVSVSASPVAEKRQSDRRLSISIDPFTAHRVRALAAKERLSDSAVVEVALRQFFNSGAPAIVLALLERFGIARQRRKS